MRAKYPWLATIIHLFVIAAACSLVESITGWKPNLTFLIAIIAFHKIIHLEGKNGD